MKKAFFGSRRLTRIARGFTLIELVVVVAILGVLIGIVAPNVIGTTDSSKAQLLIKVASNVSTNWSLISQTCGTSTAIASNPLPAANKNVKDVLFAGSASVAATYTNCYGQSKVLALTEVSQPGAAGMYNVAGYNVNVTGGGLSPLSITYAGVPETLALLMVQKYIPTVSTLSAGDDATSAVITYTAAASGARDVTLLKQI